MLKVWRGRRNEADDEWVLGVSVCLARCQHRAASARKSRTEKIAQEQSARALLAPLVQRACLLQLSCVFASRAAVDALLAAARDVEHVEIYYTEDGGSLPGERERARRSVH